MEGSLNFTINPSALFYGYFFILLSINSNSMFCNGSSSNVSCIQSERQALLSFKQHLHDPAQRLASWVGDDCCKWSGIVCSKITAHVHKLLLGDLHYQYRFDETEKRLSGEINPSLVDLKHLQHLDLSNTDIGGAGAGIPEFLGSLGSLRYLNLSRTRFSGVIPHKLGNLTNLRSLDLSYVNVPINRTTFLRAYAKNLQWLSQLSSLRYLDMTYVDLEEASDWVEVTNSLPSLVVLRLRYCKLNFNFRPIYHVNFSSLSLLDLSRNNLGNNIPLWVSNLRRLTSLYLNNITFGHGTGAIPEGIQNLTSLMHLHLSDNSFNTTIPSWLYSSSHLEVLNLGYNHLRGTISSEIKNMTSIITLDLSNNELQGKLPTSSMAQLCKLKEIHLSANEWNHSISQILDSLSGCVSNSLQVLEINDGQISGHLTNKIGQFKTLTRLDLSYNSISGPIPASLGNLSSLRFVSLGYNHINETLPESLGQLVNLEGLYIAGNQMEGIVSEAHFANTTRLIYLDASDNPLTLKVDRDWVPPFQLESLDMGSWHLGPGFPLWLLSQKNLSYLGLSSTNIEAVIPSWIDSLELQILDLSHNQMHGSIPKFSNIGYASYSGLPKIDLSHNRFEGPLPSISSDIFSLDLSNNLLSGSISQFLCDKQDQPMNLMSLKVANNQLSGPISNCWWTNKWQSLVVVDLSNNKFHGSIPPSLCSLNFLKSLHLHNNNLSGDFPSSLQNCSKLFTLNLGENNFRGSIPSWIGVRLLKMRIFSLRLNEFGGHIPDELCALTSLQILDLAYNNLSGYIPKCFNNFSTMVVRRSSDDYTTDWIEVPLINGISSYIVGVYTEDVLELVMKGQAVEYDENLRFVRSIDLSCNFLSGSIPTEITSLSNLLSLNLSNNLLTGEIPQEIGKMGELESMDFSGNQLSGEIPPSMSNLNFLGYLNLSYNDLRGRIPTGTQLQSFNASSFIGNSLYGPPLTQNYSTDHVKAPTVEKKTANEDDNGMLPSLYSGMRIGFAFGFWGVCGALFFNRTCRHAYFQLVGYIGDYIFVAYGLTMRWFSTKLKSYRQN